MSPAVSIVMPVYNVAPWLHECLSSILDDQDVDLELIAVDDGSTDGGWEILTERAATDPRLRVVRNQGKGGAQARNHGVTLATGEYLAFVDADDIVPRGAYRAMLDSARANGADHVIGSFLKFFPTRTWRPTRTWPAWEQERVGVTLAEQPSLIRNRACWNRLFNRAWWVSTGIEFPTVPRSNDVVPMTRALVEARSINVVRDTVYLYRFRPGASSMSARAGGAASFISYLTQEAESLRLTRAVGDAGLSELHGSLFLANDGWVHLRQFLVGPGPDTCTADELGQIQQAIASLSDVAGLDTAEELSWVTSRAMAYAAAGRWPLARQLALAADDAVDVPTAVEALAAARAEGVLDDDEARHYFQSVVLIPLTRRTAPAPEVAGALRAHRPLVASLYGGRDLTHLPLALQQLLRFTLEDDADRLVRVLSEDPLRFVLRRLVEKGDGVVARVVHRGPAVQQLAFHVRRGVTRRGLGQVVERGEEPLEVGVPLRRLTAGRWDLVVEATVDGVRFTAPVALSPLSPGESVVLGRRAEYVRPGSGIDAAVIVLGSGRVRRALGRVRRGVRRRLGAARGVTAA
ncbi:glycosyltransferase family 2 protein [Nocardioides jiangxiensis]|uniref:Glycosyltransferase family 2 protein n=1 Tax=Nocardioides jiangxiensis TaxID=3064524 RepID=A0ABT9B2V0_9ACTN|nr:glycosyltransferase family 2 protein [Nocardioides sp. WY-20]MDO7869180.1 glycosyltransferase family 2 protein [Nocardioides sp. WY-20]